MIIKGCLYLKYLLIFGCCASLTNIHPTAIGVYILERIITTAEDLKVIDMTKPITAWSFSRYNCWRQCPQQFKYKYIDKLKEPTSEPMLRGSRIHKEGEKYLDGSLLIAPKSYGKFMPLLEDLKELGATGERQLAFTDTWGKTSWFAKNTWVRCIIDAEYIDIADRHAEIIDFKTGKKWGDNVEQVELFTLAAFKEHKFLETATARLWYLDSGDESLFEYTRDDMDDIENDWYERVDPMMNDTEFLPRPNDKCKWCHFRRDNGGPCQYDG